MTTGNQTQPINQVIAKTLAMLASEATARKDRLESQPKSPDKMAKRMAWQSKWIRLNAHCPELRKLSDDAQDFCARFFENERIDTVLVMAGNPGCGKTHVARAIYEFCKTAAIAAFENGKWALKIPECYFVSWPRICDGFKNGNYAFMQDSEEVDLLVIDDVGAEHDPSKMGAEKLCQILSRRERRFTVITTNISPVHWEERLEARIADRLLRNSIVADLFNVPSYSTL